MIKASWLRLAAFALSLLPGGILKDLTLGLIVRSCSHVPFFVVAFLRRIAVLSYLLAYTCTRICKTLSYFWSTKDKVSIFPWLHHNLMYIVGSLKKIYLDSLDRAGRRHRGAAKRYLTQPIDREAIAQAKELHGNSQTTQVPSQCRRLFSSYT